MTKKMQPSKISIQLMGAEHVGEQVGDKERKRTVTYDYIPATFSIKRYMSSDLVSLRSLRDENTHKIFGNISIHNLVTLTYLTLVMRNTDKKIIASLSVQNYPNLLTISSSDWASWVLRIYQVKTLNLRNTMWIHLYLFARRTSAIFRKLIKEVFNRHSHVQYIAMIIPPKCSAATKWLECFGTKVLPHNFNGGYSIQALLIIDRNDFIHQYKLRRACQEDNDDILPLIQAHAPQFKEIYGEYYPAFLAKKTASGRNMIIAEYNTKTVAVLCLNSTVALQFLNEHYELETVYGLHKVHEQDERPELMQADKDLFGSMISVTETELGRLNRERRFKNLYDTEEFIVETHHFDEMITDDDVLAKSTPHNSIKKDSVSGSFSSSSSLEGAVGSDWFSVSSGTVTSTSSDSTYSDDDVITLDLKLFDDASHSGSSSDSQEQLQLVTQLLSQGSATQTVSGRRVRKPSIVAALTNYYADEDKEEDKMEDIFSALDDEYGPLALSASMYYARKSLTQKGYLQKASHIKLNLPPSDYKGEANCFAIEIAVAAPGHEAALQQLVSCCFQCYPTRDYCIFTIPTDENDCAMIDMFVRVPPRPAEVHKEDMYVIYRGSCVGDISVRRAHIMDIFAMEDLIYTTYNPDELAWLMRESLHRRINEVYVLICDRYVVGFALLRMEKRYDYISHHYELETYTELTMHKAGCVGRIEYLVMSPIFQKMSSFFLAEIHRFSGYTLMTYYILPQDGWKYRHIVVNLADLIPVKPRKVSEMVIDQESNVKVETTMAALYISTMSLCSLPKKDINYKIVVIGTSITAMAFLEALLFNTSAQYKANFNNVFVVAPSNAMLPNKPTKVNSFFFVRTSYFDYRYVNQLGLKTYINFITGVMTQIKRNEKEVVIDDDRKLLYDYLFLFCGQQFGKPHLHKTTMASEKTKRKMTKINAPSEQPKNVFIVNTEKDAAVALKMLKKLIYVEGTLKQSDKSIIVYGRCLEAYCCLAALLEFGLTGTDLIFVESSPPNNTTDYTFPYNVDKYVQETLINLGIKVFLDHHLYDYIWNERNKIITAVVLETKQRRQTVACVAMFCFSNKIYSSRTFSALHNAGLVFDGGLVINSDCSTHDKSIYAAGTLTKFSRRYYSDHLYHGKYSSQEVGYTLGTSIRKKLIMNYDEDEMYNLTYSWESKYAVHVQYVKPRIQYCILPGNLNYLYVVRPGLRIPSEFLQADNEYGSELITGSFKSIPFKKGYFKLYLNQYGSVERMTCLSRERIDYFNLIQLYGKHEKMLNNLLIRFESCTIGDLYTYFHQPWSTALYNAQYSFFEQEIRKIMMSLRDDDGELLSQKLLILFQEFDYKSLHPQIFACIKQRFHSANYHGLIAQKLFNFFLHNIDSMDMYAHPFAVRSALEGYMDSMMFKKQ